MGPVVVENVPPKNKDVDLPLSYTKQELYDYITSPLFRPINEKDAPLSLDQVNDTFLKMRATIVRYLISLVTE